MVLLPLLAAAIPAAAAGVIFEDGARQAGLDFVHEHGGSGRKYMVETVGSGVCFLDYDNDGDADLYLLQGAALPGFEAEGELRNALYRNDSKVGKVRFVDVTEEAGVGERSWGMGCTAGDIDGDGDLDLMVTNFGPDVLYRNNGDGKFTDITAAAGVGDPRWSSSAAFADADGDGDLDLYVVHYVDHSVENNRRCGAPVRGQVSYCNPSSYSPVPDSFYRNRGDGTFQEDPDALVPMAPGHGLGLVWSDLDRNGWPDLYVTNDGSPNFLFLNQAGKFEEMALLSGCAVNEDGMPEAGMGVEAQDFDGDGNTDLLVTHMAMETNTLYANQGNGQFVDRSQPSRLGAASIRRVGWGVAGLDYDLDGDLDLLVANGHVLDDPELHQENVPFAQKPQLLENDGHARFRDTGAEHGTVFSHAMVGRGVALADVDGDGDLDAAVTTSRGPVWLLLARGAEGTWIQLDLRQPEGNRFAVGARVTIQAGGKRQTREVRSASSYASQSALPLHAGLAGADEALVTVRWPQGGSEVFGPLEAGKRHLILKGEGKKPGKAQP
jgi:hypothetical protein